MAKLRQLMLRLLTEVLSPPSCAAGNCDGADFGGERFQESMGGGHEGEVAGVGDQDQFFIGRLDAPEIVNRGLGWCDDVILALNDEVGRVDIAGDLGQIGGKLVRKDVLAGELHSVFKILELFRLPGLQFARLAAKVLQPFTVRRRPKRAHMVFAAEGEVLLGVGQVGPVGFDFFDCGLIAILARFGQHQVVLRFDHGGPACHLAGANIGGEEFRAHLHHAGGDDRSPGVAEDDDPLFAEIAAEIFGEFHAVLGDAVERDIGRLCAVAAESVAGTALVPLNHGEGFLPGPVDFGLRPLRFARASVHDEQHGVRAVVAANADPLIDTTKRDKQNSIDLRGSGHSG
jgi:hypothetical protein